MNGKQTIREELNEVEKEVSTLTFSISKAVPWSLLAAIGIQSMALFFWAGQQEASFNAHVSVAQERHLNLTKQLDDRYRASQARSDLALRDERIAHNAQSNAEVKSSLGRIENALEKKFSLLMREISTHDDTNTAIRRHGVSP